MTIIKLCMSVETDAGHELQVFKVLVTDDGDMKVDTETTEDLLAGVEKTQEIIDYIRNNIDDCEDEDYED